MCPIFLQILDFHFNKLVLYRVQMSLNSFGIKGVEVLTILCKVFIYKYEGYEHMVNVSQNVYKNNLQRMNAVKPSSIKDVEVLTILCKVFIYISIGSSIYEMYIDYMKIV